MAVLRMTRAEYELKYGVKPPGSPSITTTPPAVGTPGFGTRALEVVKEAGRNVNSAISGTDQYTGQSPIRRGFEAFGQAIATPRKIAYEALPEVARSGLNTVGNVVGKGFKAVTDVVSELPAYKEYARQYPDAASSPALIKTFEDLLGTTASAGQIAGDLLTINAGAKALQKGAEIGAKGVEKVGQGVQKVGEKVYKSAYTPTADEARLIQSNQAKVKFLKNELAKTTKGTPEYADISEQLTKAQAAKPVVSSDTALRRGIAGTEKQIGLQSNVEKLDLWKNQIEPALKGTKGKITKEELFSKATERVANEVEPTRRAAFQRALESLQDDYKNFSDTDLLTANQIKTSLDKFTPSKIFKGQDVASEVKTLKSDMANAIREKTYSSITDTNIKSAYRDYANLKELEKVGIKALTTAGKKGGFGNFWSTIYEQATTPIKTIGGKVLYRVGNKLEFVGEKGVETLGQHLENIGAVTSLGKSLSEADKQAGFIKNPLAQGVDPSKTPVAPRAGSIEQAIEQAGGWKPGMRQVFDTALLREDAAALRQLLPDAPPDYVATFANKITKILSKKP